MYKIIIEGNARFVYFKDGQYAEDEFPGGFVGRIDRKGSKWYVWGRAFDRLDEAVDYLVREASADV